MIKLFLAIASALVLSWTASALNLPTDMVGISKNKVGDITLFTAFQHEVGFQCVGSWHIAAEYNKGNTSIVPDHYGCWWFEEDHQINVKYSDGTTAVFYIRPSIDKNNVDGAVLADWFVKQYPRHAPLPGFHE